MHSERRSVARSDVLKELYIWLQAVKAMHDRGMSHTDLKPGNIIISTFGADLMGLEATVVDLGGAIQNNKCDLSLCN